MVFTYDQDVLNAVKQENYVGARDRGQIGDRNAAKTTYIFRHHSYSGAGVGRSYLEPDQRDDGGNRL